MKSLKLEQHELKILQKNKILCMIHCDQRKDDGLDMD